MTECTSTYCTDENIERVHAMILASQWATVDEVAHHLHITCGFAHEIIHNRLSFNKVCVRWVSKQLRRSQMQLFDNLLMHFGLLLS
jgi:hypothetical protein